MSYFIGNVLSPTETQPEQHDKTFAFTREESAAMDLEGVPIRMEHDDQLEVGTVIKSWDERDGSKWIMGKLKEDTIRGQFARHAISKSSKGTRYYTGLSLQHTHTQYASGETKKEPVEVSLCVDPRRDDCRITFVEPSKNTHYKGRAKTIKMTDAPKTPVVTETPAPEPVEEVAKVEAPSDIPDQQRLMEILVEQQKGLDSQAEKLAKYEEMEKKRTEAEQAKAEALAKSLVTAWATQVGEEMQDMKAAESSMLKMAKEFPEESQEFFRIAHHASKKHAAAMTAAKAAKEEGANKELKATFNKVMSKQVHAASAKKKEKEQTFKDVLARYGTKSKGRDLMEEVVEISKRRRLY